MFFDNNGEYRINFASLGTSSLITLSHQVLVSNDHGTIATDIDPSAKTKAADRIPEISSISADVIKEIKTRSKILIIDDESGFLKSVKNALTRGGWQLIETASNRAKAEEILKQNKYDFIVLDSVLSGITGDETDGVTILKGIKLDPKTLNYGTPILFWSSHASIEASKGLRAFEAMHIARRNVTVRRKEEFPELEKVSDLILNIILE